MTQLNVDLDRLALRVGATFDAVHDTRSKPKSHAAIKADAAWDATARMICDVLGVGNTPWALKQAIEKALLPYYAEHPFSPTRGREAAERWMAARSKLILDAIESVR